MTQRTEYQLVCDCGHKGALMSENDSPFSKAWEQYSLSGFDGGTYHVEGFGEMDKVFAEIKPTCPKCGGKLTESNLR